MMISQLCVGAERGALCPEKAVLPLPVPLKDLMALHDLACAHQFVSDQAGSESEVA